MSLSQAQLDDLKLKVDTLVSMKAEADRATAVSNEAHTQLQVAQSNVAAADTAEASADGAVNMSLQDLKASIEALVP